MTVSNIRIVSNIYPVKTAERRNVPGFPICLEGVFNDPDFRKRIKGKAALKMLARQKCGSTNSESDDRQNLLDARLVTYSQIEVFWDQEGNGRCVDCDPGELPFGLIRTADEVRVANRCENPICRCRPEQVQTKTSP